jgi:hypothetical protein
MNRQELRTWSKAQQVQEQRVVEELVLEQQLAGALPGLVSEQLLEVWGQMQEQNQMLRWMPTLFQPRQWNQRAHQLKAILLMQVMEFQYQLCRWKLPVTLHQR